ncbi:MAG TPA: Na+/H+ antiporter NhaA [Acidimicrobiales bacterium]|jgi:NhaA family Na+:H+ antiporter|nr:Na+/H+ antiporter NhaA [Acidimicrobiales bacterium]
MAGPVSSRVSWALDHEYSAAIALAGGVAAALVWSATSPSSYFNLFTSPSSWHLLHVLDVNTVHDAVVNGLMAIFFFAMGLELSRDLSAGLLTHPKHAVPPILGAIGGMLVTALGSILLGHLLNSSALRRGWGVPMATDVAFTLGVLAIAGRRLPPLLRVFLLTLAITDDVLSVVVLSVSGTTHVRLDGLVALGVVTAAGWFMSRRATSNVASALLLVVLWLCFAWANVEPALAGVLAGLLVSTRAPSRPQLELGVARVSVGVVLPLFALVACGLHWNNVHLSGAVGTVVIATIGVRLVGKSLGITAGVAFARLLRFRLDPSLTWPLVVTTSILCAIGFTVPLLFATKLFGAQSALYAGYALGLLLSSAIAALVGGALLRLGHRPE